MAATTMMEFVLMAMITAFAWVHARLTVVTAIYVTHSAEGMLRFMLRDTWCMVVVICYYMLSVWGTWIMLYAIARSLFLLSTRWHAVCDNYKEIKRLLAGS